MFLLEYITHKNQWESQHMEFQIPGILVQTQMRTKSWVLEEMKQDEVRNCVQFQPGFCYSQQELSHIVIKRPRVLESQLATERNFEPRLLQECVNVCSQVFDEGIGLLLNL